MEKKLDIHNYDVMLESYLDKLKGNSGISKENAEKLLEYNRGNVIEGLAIPTQVKHMQVMLNVGKKIKNHK